MKGRRIAWFTLAIVACATLSLGLWGLERAGYQEAIQNAYRLTEARVAVADARVRGALGEVAQVLRSLEDYMQIHALPQVLSASDHSFLASRASDQGITRELIVVSATGVILGYSGQVVPPNTDVSDRDYFRYFAGGRPDRELFIGRPVESRLTGQAIIPIARGLYTDTGQFAGVIAAAVYPDDLRNVLPAKVAADGTAVLAREDGIVLAREPSNEEYIGRDTSDAPLFMEHLPQAPTGSYATVSPLDHRERFISYQHAPETGTVTLVSVGRDALLAAHAELRTSYIIIGVIGNVVLLLLFAMVCRQGNRRRRAVDALVESRLELARLNEELEARVLERTLDLQHSEARSRAFMEAAHDAVIVIDQDDNILEFNPAATRVFGYSEQEVTRLRFSDLVPVYDPGKPEEAVGRRKDGTRFPAECWAGELTGDVEAGSWVFIIRDISSRKHVESRLVEMATTDELTGTLNRRAFMQQAAKQFSLARRHGRETAILMIDADRFKAVNDTYGHDAGDAVLKALAKSIQSALREMDSLGRLGGEEFAALLPETDGNDAAIVAERVRAAVADTVVLHGGRDLTLTVSIGVACGYGEGGELLESVLKRADNALYAAKRGGRNRVVVAEDFKVLEAQG